MSTGGTTAPGLRGLVLDREGPARLPVARYRPRLYRLPLDGTQPPRRLRAHALTQHAGLADWQQPDPPPTPTTPLTAVPWVRRSIGAFPVAVTRATTEFAPRYRA